MNKTTREINLRRVGISGIIDRLDESIYYKFLQELRGGISNPTKVFAIAVVLINPRNEKEFLAVKRPPDARTLPNVWGLPAITIEYEEDLSLTVLRLAKEKLDTKVEFIGCLGFDSVNRGEYDLILMDVVARLSGKDPSVLEAPTKHTKYVQQKWTSDLTILREAAFKGSLCSRILLRSQGLLY
jgi:ADP-ribose pyrophosphatase YjhB (NUDIX family)